VQTVAKESSQAQRVHDSVKGEKMTGKGEKAIASLNNKHGNVTTIASGSNDSKDVGENGRAEENQKTWTGHEKEQFPWSSDSLGIGGKSRGGSKKIAGKTGVKVCVVRSYS